EGFVASTIVSACSKTSHSCAPICTSARPSGCSSLALPTCAPIQLTESRSNPMGNRRHLMETKIARVAETTAKRFVCEGEWRDLFGTAFANCYGQYESRKTSRLHRSRVRLGCCPVPRGGAEPRSELRRRKGQVLREPRSSS